MIGIFAQVRGSKKLFVQYPNFRSSTRKFDPCIMQNLARDSGIPMDDLGLLIWSNKTGKILK